MLTETEQKALDFIRTYISEYGKSPKLLEIGEALGINSKGTVHRYVQSLIDKGFLQQNHKGWRGWSLIEQQDGCLPLLGAIAAGKPIEAIAGQEELDISNLFVGSDCYVLRVKGDSMIEIGIMDDDYVVIQKKQTAADGDIVVALIDNEQASLKRFKRYKNGKIALHPENKTMSPIVVDPEQVEIQGHLAGVLRICK